MPLYVSGGQRCCHVSRPVVVAATAVAVVVVKAVAAIAATIAGAVIVAVFAAVAAAIVTVVALTVDARVDGRRGGRAPPLPGDGAGGRCRTHGWLRSTAGGGEMGERRARWSASAGSAILRPCALFADFSFPRYCTSILGEFNGNKPVFSGDEATAWSEILHTVLPRLGNPLAAPRSPHLRPAEARACRSPHSARQCAHCPRHQVTQSSLCVRSSPAPPTPPPPLPPTPCCHHAFCCVRLAHARWPAHPPARRCGRRLCP